MSSSSSLSLSEPPAGTGVVEHVSVERLELLDDVSDCIVEYLPQVRQLVLECLRAAQPSKSGRGETGRGETGLGDLSRLSLDPVMMSRRHSSMLEGVGGDEESRTLEGNVSFFVSLMPLIVADLRKLKTVWKTHEDTLQRTKKELRQYADMLEELEAQIPVAQQQSTKSFDSSHTDTTSPAPMDALLSKLKAAEEAEDRRVLEQEGNRDSGRGRDSERSRDRATSSERPRSRERATSRERLRGRDEWDDTTGPSFPDDRMDFEEWFLDWSGGEECGRLAAHRNDEFEARVRVLGFSSDDLRLSVWVANPLKPSMRDLLHTIDKHAGDSKTLSDRVKQLEAEVKRVTKAADEDGISDLPGRVTLHHKSHLSPSTLPPDIESRGTGSSDDPKASRAERYQMKERNALKNLLRQVRKSATVSPLPPTHTKEPGPMPQFLRSVRGRIEALVLKLDSMT